MMIQEYEIGDRVEMKKNHPCGSKVWVIERTGVDIKLRCEGCDHRVMLARPKFEKGLKKVLKHPEE